MGYNKYLQKCTFNYDSEAGRPKMCNKNTIAECVCRVLQTFAHFCGSMWRGCLISNNLPVTAASQDIIVYREVIYIVCRQRVLASIQTILSSLNSSDVQ